MQRAEREKERRKKERKRLAAAAVKAKVYLVSRFQRRVLDKLEVRRYSNCRSSRFTLAIKPAFVQAKARKTSDKSAATGALAAFEAAVAAESPKTVRAKPKVSAAATVPLPVQKPAEGDEDEDMYSDTDGSSDSSDDTSSRNPFSASASAKAEVAVAGSNPFALAAGADAVGAQARESSDATTPTILSSPPKVIPVSPASDKPKGEI